MIKGYERIDWKSESKIPKSTHEVKSELETRIANLGVKSAVVEINSADSVYNIRVAVPKNGSGEYEKFALIRHNCEEGAEELFNIIMYVLQKYEPKKVEDRMITA